jgi:hypothetical protein
MPKKTTYAKRQVIPPEIKVAFDEQKGCHELGVTHGIPPIMANGKIIWSWLG